MRPRFELNLSRQIRNIHKMSLRFSRRNCLIGVVYCSKDKPPDKELLLETTSKPCIGRYQVSYLFGVLMKNSHALFVKVFFMLSQSNIFVYSPNVTVHTVWYRSACLIVMFQIMCISLLETWSSSAASILVRCYPGGCQVGGCLIDWCATYTL